MANEQLESLPAHNQIGVSLPEESDKYVKPVSALLDLVREFNPDTLENEPTGTKILAHEISSIAQTSLQSLLDEQKYFRLAEESGTAAKHQLDHLFNLLKILKCQLLDLTAEDSSDPRWFQPPNLDIEQLLKELTCWIEEPLPFPAYPEKNAFTLNEPESRQKLKKGGSQSRKIHSNEIHIKTFGKFEITFDLEPANEFKNAKGKQLLKYLIINRRRIIPKEELMELLWPSHDELSARNNLNVVVYSLRRAAKEYIGEEPLIRFSDGGYQFNPKLNITTDFEEFDALIDSGIKNLKNQYFSQAIEQLQRAESLYNGRFLDEDIYTEWTEAPRESYKEKFILGLESLDNAYCAAGEHEERIELNKRILEQDNCNELAHQHLIEAYDKLGHRHLALRQYQQVSRILQKELGVTPGDGLTALQARISKG